MKDTLGDLSSPFLNALASVSMNHDAFEIARQRFPLDLVLLDFHRGTVFAERRPTSVLRGSVTDS